MFSLVFAAARLNQSCVFVFGEGLFYFEDKSFCS